MPMSEMQRSANQAIHLEVRAGVRPHANTIPCSECGHIFDGKRRHEWHHHRGYEREHWFEAVVLCSKCHARHGAKAQQTHCKHGHEYDVANTYRNRNGTRRCRRCSNLRGSARAKLRRAARRARGLRKPWDVKKGRV